MSEQSDAWHVERVRNGDREAFRTLVERYQGMVYDLTCRYADRRAESEDLAQDIFLLAYQRLEQLDRADRFASWLYAMALNQCRDYAKNVRRETYAMSETDERPDRQESKDPSIVDDLVVAEASDRLWEAIYDLDPKYLIPLLLKYRDDLSYAVISERLDVTVGALKVRVHRARKQLQEQLSEEL